MRALPRCISFYGYALTSCNTFFKSGVSFNAKVVPIDICSSLEAAIEAALQNRCFTDLLNIVEKRM